MQLWGVERSPAGNTTCIWWCQRQLQRTLQGADAAQRVWQNQACWEAALILCQQPVSQAQLHTCQSAAALLLTYSWQLLL